MDFVRRDVSYEDQEREIDELFKRLYAQANVDIQRGDKGLDIFPKGTAQPFFSAIWSSLKDEDARDFNEKKKALCAIARIEYDNSQWVERCVIFIPENLPALTIENNIIWHLCKAHNTSGVHTSGSLLP